MTIEPAVRIFISHSSHSPVRTGQSEADKSAIAKAEAHAQQVVKDVASKLEADGYTVLLDMSCIAEGSMWRRYIHQALSECDAAVIILSDWSLASAWVRYEATVLTERAWQDDRFKLLPILIPGTDKKTIDAGDWRPLQLREIQTPASDDPDTIVATIKKFVGGATRRLTPFDRMLDDIGRSLENVPVAVLQRACDDFGIGVAWTLHADRSRSLADILSRRVLRDDTAGVGEAVKILDALKPHLRRTFGETIVAAIAPLWVSQSAASALAIAATKKLPTLRDVALNGWKIRKFTADQYVRRAFPFTDLWELARIGDEYPPDFVEHVRTELRAWVKATFSEHAESSPDEIDRYINRSVPNLFVLLPTIPEPDELDALRTAYEKVTFICAVSGERPDAVDMPDGVVFLEPPISSNDIEEKALGEIAAARRFVDKLPP